MTAVQTSRSRLRDGCGCSFQPDGLLGNAFPVNARPLKSADKRRARDE